MALVAGLLAVLPMSSAWASSTTTYYAALKAAVSSTGGGKVYAGTSNSAGTYAATSTSDSQNSTTKDASKTFYAFAQADSGYEFAGWSDTDGGTANNTDNPRKVTVSCSSTDSTKPTTTTLYANFSKLKLESFGITFVTSAGGTYTVDGKTPANKTALTEATTVKLASSDPNFLNWKVNGAIVNGNPYDLTCLEDTTVSAEFLTADQVAEATTFDTLTAALANKKKVTIPAGADITIAKGATLTVPAGKQLVVDGSLAVVGTLANGGAISGSGTIYKISYLIEQGEVKKPLQVTGEEWGNMTAKAYKPYYRVTTTTANTPTVPSTISGCASFWAVLFKGKAVKISKQSPKAIKVTFNTAVAANDISTIADNADVDTVGDDYCVLLADCGITGYNDNKGRAVYSKTVDCAGKTVTMSGTGGKIAGSSALFLNGAVSISPSSENQNSAATFINCSSITLKKIKGVSPTYYFYDCGSAGKMATLSFAYYSGPNTTNYRQAYFYSGYYSYTFSSAADATDGGGRSYVYNGSFSSDPTAYLQQSASPNGLKVEGTNPYKVVENVAAVNCVQVGGTQYASLAEAVSAVSSGGTLSLILPVSLTEKLVIPSGKKVTIDLNGLNLSGGSIENSGALRFEDNSGAAQPGTLSTPVVGKAGTIDITFGAYAGSFRMEGGVLTTHNGTFASTFSATEAGGTVSLRGGQFMCAITVPDDCRMRSNYLGQKVIGHIADASRIGDADVSYLVNGFNPNDDLNLGASDKALYLNFMQSKSGWSSRGDFVGREAQWDRLAELRSVGEPIKGQAFEASISFDRAVNSGTVCGWAKILGSAKEMDMDQNLDPEEDYHILIPLVTGSGYTAKSFKHMFDGEDNGVWEQVHCGVENTSLDNIGTTVTVKFQIRMGGQKAGYTFDTERYRTYKFTGNGAIAGNTDYTSLATAVEKVAVGGTVRLSKDCNETVSVGKACTIDLNNFEFTGTITAAEGYAVSEQDGVYEVAELRKIEVVTDEESGSGEEAFSVVVTGEELEKLGVGETTTDEEVKEILNERDESGLKNWEVIVVEQEKAKPNPTVVLAPVVETVNEKGQKVLTTGAQVENVDTSDIDYASLPAGNYRKAFVAEDANGKAVTIADTDKEEPTVAVVKNESKDKTIILPVPGVKEKGVKLTVADVIDERTLTPDDVVTFYDTDGVKKEWTYLGDDKWSDAKTQTEAGLVGTAASGCPLPAGGAFWLTRVNPEKPVVIVAEVPETVEQTVTKDEWNLAANPSSDSTTETPLDNVVQNPGADDEIIIPTANGVQKKVKYDSQKGWKYKQTKVVNGRVTKEEVSAGVKGGQGFWYISNGAQGGETKIKWK